MPGEASEPSFLPSCRFISGDVSSPGNSYYYGTSTGGTKGWNALAGGGVLLYSNTTIPAGNTSTSTSETTLTSSYTIPANTLVAGDVVVVRLAGVYSGTVLPNITGKVKFGSVTMLTTGSIPGLVTGTNLAWWAEGRFIVQSTGVSGSIKANATLQFASAATAALNILLSSTSTVDTTVTEAITVTVQWGMGGTGQTITMEEFIVEKETAQGGPGTVTSVSVVTANGLSGSVATATTTPAITLSYDAGTSDLILASQVFGG